MKVTGDEPEFFREAFDVHARTIYTRVPARLIAIDGNGLGIVQHYHYLGCIATKVPIERLYVGDNYGESHALHLPEYGHMLCANYPAEEARDPTMEDERPSMKRHHAFMDGYFVPDIRRRDEAQMGGPLAQYLYRHKSGAERRITTDGREFYTSSNGDEVAIENGTLTLTRVDPNSDAESHQARLDQNGATLEHESGNFARIEENAARIRVERPDGKPVRVDVEGSDISISLPDKYNDQADGEPRSEISVSDDGTAELNGRAHVGDRDAYREDPTTENTDSEDPRRYAETTEPVEPILDPTNDTETQYRNPSTVTAHGPVDLGFYALRNVRFGESREKDPDPAVTDPTDPAFIALPEEWRQKGELPRQLVWFNTTEQIYKTVDQSGQPAPFSQFT